MKVAVTYETNAYQYSENGYSTDKFTKIFDYELATVKDMLDWARKKQGGPVPLGRLIISEVSE